MAHEQPGQRLRYGSKRELSGVCNPQRLFSLVVTLLVNTCLRRSTEKFPLLCSVAL